MSHQRTRHLESGLFMKSSTAPDLATHFSGTKKLCYQAISQINQLLFKLNNISIDISFSLTYKPGHYIYLEASNPRRRGDTALLLLKLEGSSFCMRFWYHMYGSSMGSLKIVHIIKQGTIKDEPANDDQPKTIDFTQGLRESRGTRKIVWQKSGNHRNKWHQAELDLKHGKSAVHWVSFNEMEAYFT